MKKKDPDFETEYQEQINLFVEKIKRILTQEKIGSPQEINYSRVKSNWNTGKLLHQASNNSILSQKSNTLTTLAEALNTSRRNLFAMQSFYRAWPKKLPDPNAETSLRWSVHRTLLKAKTSTARKFYYQRARQHNWTKEQLAKAIKMKLHENPNTLERFREGKIEKLSSLLFTFEAQVLKVLDGDTLRVDIDLGFGSHVNQELRLRGINCPELHDKSGAGQSAKTFVAEKLPAGSWIVIVTYKTDKYGRYVVDVYYSDVYKDAEDIVRHGEFLNQQLLQEGLAVRVEY